MRALAFGLIAAQAAALFVLATREFGQLKTDTKGTIALCLCLVTFVSDGKIRVDFDGNECPLQSAANFVPV